VGGAGAGAQWGAVALDPHAPRTSRAFSWPTSPAEISFAVPSASNPKPLMCVCTAIRAVFVVDLTSSICGRGKGGRGRAGG
jgi:hypothetical protein